MSAKDFNQPSNQKAYWYKNELHWIDKKAFAETKKNKKILWCPENKEWVHYLTIIKYNSLNKDNILLIKKIAIIKNQNPITLCPSCNKNWKHQDCKEHPQLEILSCPICISRPMKPNPIYTERTILKGYHSHKKEWQFQIQRLKKKQDRTTLPMGLEIEINTKKLSPYKAAWNIYSQSLEHKQFKNQFYCEEDGSLGSGGFEIITNPMTLKYHKEYWAYLLPIIRQYCVGWDAERYGGSSTYGIHITINRKYWTDIQIARLARFWNNPSNQDFLQAIAQRKYLYCNTLGIGEKNIYISNLITKKDGKLDKSTTKYTPINLKDKLIELRPFRSTLNPESFMKNIEFVDAFWNWVTSTPYSINYESFLNWLNTKQERKDLYNNLIGFLSRAKFACQFRTPFDNPFQKFMKVPKLKTFEDMVPSKDTNGALDLEDLGDLLYVPDNSNTENQTPF